MAQRRSMARVARRALPMVHLSLSSVVGNRRKSSWHRGHDRFSTRLFLGKPMPDLAVSADEFEPAAN